jgi:hypothetical protein
MDLNHREDRITITEQEHRLLNPCFSAPLGNFFPAQVFASPSTDL